jgi:clan AA aspartic protease (TIGR02281 family)
MLRSFVLLCVAHSLFFVARAAVLGDDPAPESVLKEKGLKRSGTYYVLAAEPEVQKKLTEARAAYNRLTLASTRKQAFEEGRQQADAEIRQLLEQRILLNRLLTQASTPVENNRLVGMLGELDDRVTLMQKQFVDPDVNQAVGARVAMQREEFMLTVLDARELVNRTQEQYAVLAMDDEVATALGLLNQKTKTRLSLGPSKAFLANVGLLEKVESSVLTEKINLRKKGGITWVDVTLNGKVTESFAFDTGASSVVLPAELAAKVGLNPTSETATVETQVADGTVITAKRMVIPSVRVGKFTLKDVPCIVMPPSKANVTPLLGGSFHKHFTVNYNAELGTLVLSRVDAEEKTEAPSPKSKAATKAARGKRAQGTAGGDPSPSADEAVPKP